MDININKEYFLDAIKCINSKGFTDVTSKIMETKSFLVSLYDSDKHSFESFKEAYSQYCYLNDNYKVKSFSKNNNINFDKVIGSRLDCYKDKTPLHLLKDLEGKLKSSTLICLCDKPLYYFSQEIESHVNPISFMSFEDTKNKLKYICIEGNHRTILGMYLNKIIENETIYINNCPITHYEIDQKQLNLIKDFTNKIKPFFFELKVTYRNFNKDTFYKEYRVITQLYIKDKRTKQCYQKENFTYNIDRMTESISKNDTYIKEFLDSTYSAIKLKKRTYLGKLLIYSKLLKKIFIRYIKIQTKHISLKVNND
ncbi:hypothetical protein [Arcobacter sp. F2176]|uniref:hypothetical protein n=1 Tax=Arcobacter sp. F2176 TaxID=2044511 RepID=UPI00100B0C55|nr:hypothetical protein [Arcobacter sp. F2176]RXJ79336.1 hypothetical protein CRU95_14455 [Arcobacter sp. F2176]